MYKVKVNEKYDFELLEENGAFKLAGQDLQLDRHEPGAGHVHIIYNHKSYRAEVVSQDQDNKTAVVKVNGTLYNVAAEDQYDGLLKAMGLTGAAGKMALELKAPMPGLVLSLNVTEGQEIKKGDSLLVLEAMKMENMLKAASDGTVKKIFVAKGDKVEKNQVLIEFSA
ncbi:biotin carboxyl carrier protein [Pedobacter westerhofensis]|jgi:biotin carboxyl carrier protein|uniref:Biotin carboxyl carrier protein n=1 Tax=Pedobacter westerhofensis TaxID=425512 RepID=A0A521CCH8_9SPHI|nr:acetyl-CoA carboxylase biotin carboxyl carrier protein subunit [Pedobacter westerhofensis]SMO57137.1 biotin carboxyl carrier protein [Pedobacter westerhofensis]